MTGMAAQTKGRRALGQMQTVGWQGIEFGGLMTAISEVWIFDSLASFEAPTPV